MPQDSSSQHAGKCEILQYCKALGSGTCRRNKRECPHSRYSTSALPSGAIVTAPPVSCSKGGRTRTTTFTRSAQQAAMTFLSYNPI